MPSLNDKLEITELFDRYLLCLDERRFSIDEFAKIFTQDVKISMPSKMPSMKRANGLKELR
ncbi:MAG: nuclear transport factor 2 family protein, partial [Synergistaceae bacterium]|nr:nuclear transport factor 2 family protein [Synergistaceae bacterium]